MSNLISDIMETDIIHIDVSETLKEAANVFENIKIRHLPVMSGNTLLGIISKSDVARMKQFCQILDSGDKKLFSELESVSVKVIMKRPITISPDDTIQDTIEILTKNHFHALPVLSDGKMIGIVTSTDIMKHFYHTEKEK